MAAIAAARLWSPVGGAPWKGGGNPNGGGGRLPSDDGGSIGAVCVGGGMKRDKNRCLYHSIARLAHGFAKKQAQNIHNSYRLSPRSLWGFETRRPEAVASRA